MDITCSREKLMDNLNIVSKAVSNRTTLPILECILLSADENGLKMIANDLEMGIESSYIQADVAAQGSVAIESKMFIDIIRRLPDGNDVHIKTEENNITVITCNKTEFKILGQSGDEFPILPDVEKTNEYQIDALTLRNMIRQTIFAVSVDESKPVLTGELFEVEDSHLTVVAVDGFRVGYRYEKLQNECDNVSVVIPSKTLNEISKILSGEPDDIVSLYFTDKHCLVQTQACTVVSRLLEGEFLKYKQIFTEDYSTMIQVDKLLLIQSLERASLISKETKKNPVKLQMENNMVKITSNTEMGTSYDELMVDLEGNDLEIAFNPRYLIDALKSIEDDSVYIQFTTPLSPCIIKGEAPHSFKYLVLPLRLKA